MHKIAKHKRTVQYNFCAVHLEKKLKYHSFMDMGEKNGKIHEKVQKGQFHNKPAKEPFQPITPAPLELYEISKEKPNSPNDSRCLKVTVAGPQNSGKSMLVNALMERKVFLVLVFFKIKKFVFH